MNVGKGSVCRLSEAHAQSNAASKSSRKRCAASLAKGAETPMVSKFQYVAPVLSGCTGVDGSPGANMPPVMGGSLASERLAGRLGEHSGENGAHCEHSTCITTFTPLSASKSNGPAEPEAKPKLAASIAGDCCVAFADVSAVGEDGSVGLEGVARTLGEGGSLRASSARRT